MSGSPAKDGVASFWKTAQLEEGLRRAIFLEFLGYLMVPVMIDSQSIFNIYSGVRKKEV